MNPSKNMTEQRIHRKIPNKLDALIKKEGVVFFDSIHDLPNIDVPSEFNIAIFALHLDGESELSINLKDYKIGPNSIALLKPKTLLMDGGRNNDDVTGSYIIFSPEAMGGISTNFIHNLNTYLYIQENPVTKLTRQETEEIKEFYLFMRAQIQAHANLPYRNDIKFHLLVAFFYKVVTTLENHLPKRRYVQNRQRDLFGQFLELLKENYRENRSVTFYAEKLYITPKYLSALSKNITDLTAGEWIDKYVVLETKRMLKTTTLSIQEIAEQLSFPNQSFFGKYFKSHTGLSPKEYRNS